MFYQITEIQNKYCVVMFINNQDDNEYAAVPTNWLSYDEKHCYWTENKNIRKMIKKRETPNANWSSYEVTVIKKYGTFEEALAKEKKLLVTSSQTDERDDNLGKSQRKRKAPKLSDSDDTDSSTQSVEEFKPRYFDKAKYIKLDRNKHIGKKKCAKLVTKFLDEYDEDGNISNISSSDSEESLPPNLSKSNADRNDFAGITFNTPRHNASIVTTKEPESLPSTSSRSRAVTGQNTEQYHSLPKCIAPIVATEEPESLPSTSSRSRAATGQDMGPNHNTPRRNAPIFATKEPESLPSTSFRSRAATGQDTGRNHNTPRRNAPIFSTEEPESLPSTSSRSRAATGQDMGQNHNTPRRNAPIFATKEPVSLPSTSSRSRAETGQDTEQNHLLNEILDNIITVRLAVTRLEQKINITEGVSSGIISKVTFEDINTLPVNNSEELKKLDNLLNENEDAKAQFMFILRHIGGSNIKHFSCQNDKSWVAKNC